MLHNFRQIDLMKRFLDARATRKNAGRRGYSLAELILGAAVIAAFLVRIYQSYAATSAADKFQDFTQEIGLVNGVVHETFINSPDYSGANEQAVAGSLPRKYVDSTGAVKTVYQKALTVKPNTDASGFNIFAQVPAGDCLKAAFGDMGRNETGITIGGSAATATTAPTHTYPLAAGDTTTIQGECNAGTGGLTGNNLVGIQFHFAS